MTITLEMGIGLAALLLVPALAALATSRLYPWLAGEARERGSGRVARVVDVAIQEWGGLRTALVLLLAGAAAIVAVEWVAGLGAHALQGVLDWPVFRWTQAHQTAWWTDVWWKLTQIGSPSTTQRLVVAGAVLLAVVWRKRLWWLPGLWLALGYVFEKYGQIILKLVVDRGHPPTTMGTWPSGGCARVLLVYGLIAYFLVRRHHAGRTKAAWVVAAAGTWLCLTIQAYARLNNLEHWFTDVLGGILYGSLLLALMVAGAEIVLRGRRSGRRTAPSSAEAGAADDAVRQTAGRGTGADRAVAGRG